MPKVDYLWITLGIFAVILIIAWGPLTRWYREVRYQATNQEEYDRGKEVFYNDTIWAGEGSYKSCAACHAADFVPPEEVEIPMQEYRPGQPYELENIAKKYGTNMLSSDDPLFDQIIKCLTNPARMGCGRVSRNAKHMQDLLVYVRRQ